MFGLLFNLIKVQEFFLLQSAATHLPLGRRSNRKNGLVPVYLCEISNPSHTIPINNGPLKSMCLIRSLLSRIVWKECCWYNLQIAAYLLICLFFESICWLADSHQSEQKYATWYYCDLVSVEQVLPNWYCTIGFACFPPQNFLIYDVSTQSFVHGTQTSLNNKANLTQYWERANIKTFFSSSFHIHFVL